MRRSSNFGFDSLDMEVESIALNDAAPSPRTDKSLPSVPFAMQYAKKNAKPKGPRTSQIKRTSQQTNSPLRKSFAPSESGSDVSDGESIFDGTEYRDSFMSSVTSDGLRDQQTWLGSQL
jgi:hypothetical protein